MANFNNKNGHWITTKDGRRIFIKDEVNSKHQQEQEQLDDFYDKGLISKNAHKHLSKNIGKGQDTRSIEEKMADNEKLPFDTSKEDKAHISALSKRRAEKRANDILAKYPFTDNRKADDIDAKGLRDALQQFYEKNNGSAVGHTIEDKDGALYIDGEMTHQFDISDTLNRRIGRTTPKEGEPDYEAKQLDKQDNEAEPKKETENQEVLNKYFDEIYSGKNWEHRGGDHGYAITKDNGDELVAFMGNDGYWHLKEITDNGTTTIDLPMKTDKFLNFSEGIKDFAKDAKQALASPGVKKALDTLDKVLEIYTNEGTDVLTAGFYTDFLKLVQEQKDEILRTMK